MNTESNNQQALQLLETITGKVRENPDTAEVLAVVKIDGEYHRFSSGLTDMMQLVAVLELAKHDTLCRMRE